MVLVIWDPLWFPEEDKNDVEFMQKVHLTSCSRIADFEFLPNEMWYSQFSNRSAITEEQQFLINDKLYERQLLNGKFYKNSITYIVLVQNSIDSYWRKQNGLLVFGSFSNKKEWEKLVIDFDMKKDINDLLKYRTLSHFPSS